MRRDFDLAVLPKSGHTINLEEPDAFNRSVSDFFAAVEANRQGARDPIPEQWRTA
ncbi:MAG: alpha/beta fold hydrolase [Acidiferrobacterales bacterium]